MQTATIDTTGIEELFEYLLMNGRVDDAGNELTFEDVERIFNIKPYPSKPGGRAHDMWKSFYEKWTETGISPAEYVKSISNRKETRTSSVTNVNTGVIVIPSDASVFDRTTENVERSYQSMEVVPYKRGKVGVLNVTDFHLGADVRALVQVPEFNTDILVDKLNTVVSAINSFGYSEVHVNMLGDYFESVSGVNHPTTFKSLYRDGYGWPVIRLARMIVGKFLRQINNLVAVNMISGNHDRGTPTKDIDTERIGAEGLCDLLSDDISYARFTYSPHLIVTDIDGICYILTHGDLQFNKRNQTHIVHNYGIPGLYSLWLSGHIHCRKTAKLMEKRHIELEEYDAVSIDEANHRKIVLPSLFTGNFYSETLGYTTCGGFVITENNGNDKPNVFDYSL